MIVKLLHNPLTLPLDSKLESLVLLLISDADLEHDLSFGCMEGLVILLQTIGDIVSFLLVVVLGLRVLLVCVVQLVEFLEIR